MDSDARIAVRDSILTKATDLGATLAGIASVDALRRSPSAINSETSHDSNYDRLMWPAKGHSVLVLGLSHRPSEPGLDWWSDIPGKTPGNYRLMQISRSLKEWLERDLDIKARPLPYRLDRGGIPLKDAAILAGLGVIGKSNLVISPEYGPCIRWRGLFLDRELKTIESADFEPCDGCDMPCRGACPQDAFRNGSFSRLLCHNQMYIDLDQAVRLDEWIDGFSGREVVKFCRACELACPVAG
jgi:epoxyqueuosine reductase